VHAKIEVMIGRIGLPGERPKISKGALALFSLFLSSSISFSFEEVIPILQPLCINGTLVKHAALSRLNISSVSEIASLGIYCFLIYVETSYL